MRVKNEYIKNSAVFVFVEDIFFMSHAINLIRLSSVE